MDTMGPRSGIANGEGSDEQEHRLCLRGRDYHFLLGTHVEHKLSRIGGTYDRS